MQHADVARSEKLAASIAPSWHAFFGPPGAWRAPVPMALDAPLKATTPAFGTTAPRRDLATQPMEALAETPTSDVRRKLPEPSFSARAEAVAKQAPREAPPSSRREVANVDADALPTTSLPWGKIAGSLAAVGALIGLVVVLAGGDEPTTAKDPASTSAATTPNKPAPDAAPKPAVAPTPRPAEATKPSPAPAETAKPEAKPEPEVKPDPAPQPVAQVPRPTVPAPKAPAPGPAPKAKPKPGGGISRDNPFD